MNNITITSIIRIKIESKCTLKMETFRCPKNLGKSLCLGNANLRCLYYVFSNVSLVLFKIRKGFNPRWTTNWSAGALTPWITMSHPLRHEFFCQEIRVLFQNFANRLGITIRINPLCNLECLISNIGRTTEYTVRGLSAVVIGISTFLHNLSIQAYFRSFQAIFLATSFHFSTFITQIRAEGESESIQQRVRSTSYWLKEDYIETFFKVLSTLRFRRMIFFSKY